MLMSWEDLTEQHHSMAWGPRLYKKERGVSTSTLLLPVCDTIWPAASGPCHMTSLPLTVSQSKPYLSFVAFVTAKRKVTDTMAECCCGIHTHKAGVLPGASEIDPECRYSREHED